MGDMLLQDMLRSYIWLVFLLSRPNKASRFHLVLNCEHYLDQGTCICTVLIYFENWCFNLNLQCHERQVLHVCST